ncbi:gamma carbonic anhydrase family protein [Ensifer sp. IC4062]|nr:gamma carbonic anhydrase family protein [Ensifer sp. IC4062]MCA1440716.1 gamma carbonic anhydrase family protein [Ensifer sp. IC4062]
MPFFALGSMQPQTPAEGSYWVAPDANIIGHVEIGEDVGIWFGATLRGDNEPIRIGARTNIQEAVIIHVDPAFPTTIGEGCTIGHRAIIHGCSIGDNSLIGMGATVLNGAQIGRNCLVGANALITEGKQFPDNSLIVGAPAKVIRTLDDASVERLKRSAEHYVKNWQRYAVQLTRLD